MPQSETLSRSRIRVTIDLGALRRNARTIIDNVGESLLFVVKKDAYGHGAVACARALEEEGVEGLGVFTIGEAMELREAGIQTPILAFSPAQNDEEAAVAIRAGLTLTVHDPESVARLERTASATGGSAIAHLKVDTGLGRVGWPAECQDEILQALNAAKHVVLEGVYSHLSDSKNDPELTARQAKRFRTLIERLGDRPLVKHLANSAGTLIPECRFDVSRPGMGLYGGLAIMPFTEPVMTVEAPLIQIREYEPGDTISYGATYIVQRRMRIAVVAAGYGDGVSMVFSNCGSVAIHGMRAPILGVICMDQFMVDVSGIDDAQVGDMALLFGRNAENASAVWEFASAANASAYELTTVIGRLASQRRYIS